AAAIGRSQRSGMGSPTEARIAARIGRLAGFAYSRRGSGVTRITGWGFSSGKRLMAATASPLIGGGGPGRGARDGAIVAGWSRPHRGGLVRGGLAGLSYDLALT